MFLQIGLVQGVQEMRVDVNNVNRNVHVVAAQLSDAQMREFRRWWTTLIEEIRDMHRDKTSNQEPNTCRWITMEPDLVNWLQGGTATVATMLNSPRFLWVWGIPGSGKTVMASFLIDQVGSAIGQKNCAYYYCLHSRGKDETVDFLRCIIKELQLSADFIPENIQQRFHEDVRPTEEDMLESLVHLAEKLGRICIVVDAIDESQNRGRIARVLHKIGTCNKFWKISLLVTSRDETDIREIFTRQSPRCVEIPMSGAGVKQDMRKIARRELGKIQGWNEAMTTRVENELVDRAQGMFRWLVCQLDLVKRLNQEAICDEQYIMQQIRSFPEDLFGTYERILTQIKDTDREFARIALALLCNPRTPITSAEILVEVSLYKVPLGNINAFNVDRLRNVCSCLVTVTRRKDTRLPTKFNSPEVPVAHKVVLAHYTVKEYLFSRHAAEGKASFFALSEDFLRIVDLVAFFRALQRFGYRANALTSRKNLVHPSDEYALAVTEGALSQRRLELMGNAELVDLVWQSLKPTSQHAAYLRQVSGIKATMRKEFPLWEKLLFGIDARPMGQCRNQIEVLLNLMLLGWPEMARKYIEESPDFRNLGRRQDEIWTTTFSIDSKNYETLLGYVVRTRNGAFLDLFIDKKAFFDCESEVLFDLLQSLSDSGDDGDLAFSMFKKVLQYGANANPKPFPRNRQPGSGAQEEPSPEQFAFTPLQIAIMHLEPEWVEVLLYWNANVDGCGIEGGYIPKAFAGDRKDDHLTGDFLSTSGLKKPLEICEIIRPEWASDNNKNQVQTARRDIRNALKRWMERVPDETRPQTGSVDNPQVVS
ncbi:hypothetical protein PG995_012827 [Apiospora arundinis]